MERPDPNDRTYDPDGEPSGRDEGSHDPEAEGPGRDLQSHAADREKSRPDDRNHAPDPATPDPEDRTYDPGPGMTGPEDRTHDPAAHRASGPEAPTFAPEGGGAPIPDAEERIGPYHILEVLGEGGMGTVYLAEQTEPVRRRVALKLVKLGMDSRQVVARFESERQALAMMNHRHVAKVLDGGVTDRGRPYFVMEFVPGTPITEYCNDTRLTTRDRLELFIGVCEAIQHAHQKGIIHRDIKPTNVLVSDEQGSHVPKVIDFGIAKATDQSLTDATLYTQEGMMIGTPAYMSPEQAAAAADIDTRTDVYSLGVLLYELLVGALPFDPKSMREMSVDEVRRRIVEVDPPRPSTRLSTLGETSVDAARHRRTDLSSLRRQLRGDLDWILMKSLEKDRNRRYETANGLAMDIRRYLDNEPVVARPPSTAYKLQKFVRRNRVAMIAASAILVAILAGLTAATAGFIQARRERDRAREAQARARNEADKATATNEFLTDMLASARPARTQGREITVRELLDQSSETVGDSYRDQPEVEAAVRLTIGTAYDALGLFDTAGAHLSRSLELYQGTLGDEHTETARAMNQMAKLRLNQGRKDEAQALWVRALEILRRALGEDDPIVLTAMQNLGAVYLDQERYDDAEELLARVVAGRSRVLGEEHLDTMASMANLAVVYDKQKRYEQAEPLLERVLELRRRVLGGRHPRTLISMYNLGGHYDDLGLHERADELYLEALEGFRAVYKDDHPYTLTVSRKRAALLVKMNRLAEAEVLALECYERCAKRYGPDNSNTLRTAQVLADLYQAWGKTERAAVWSSRLSAGGE